MPSVRLFFRGPLLWALLCVGACARTPTFELADVDLDLTPGRAVAQIDSVRGRKVQWGGVLIGTRNLKDTTQLEILAYPLDEDGRPKRRDAPLGRFLALQNGYLEPVDYAPDREVTVVGTVQDTRTGSVGQASYTYPVVAMQQLHLWPKASEYTEPRFHFGIGVGIIR